MLEQHFHLKFQVQLQILFVVDLNQQAQYGHQPGVRRLVDFGVLARLQKLGHKRDHGDHAAALVSLENDALGIEIAHQHRLVARDGELTQPRSQVLEQRALARVGLDLVRRQQNVHIAHRCPHHLLQERRLLNLVDECQVQGMEVGLDGRALHHHVLRKPQHVRLPQVRVQLHRLLLQILLGEVVHQEVDLVHHPFVGLGECGFALRLHERL
mmetsp:Transcript_48271/g.92296  ORF Transcript_48271/g.92296 Transcript_48271/m.92296 type:complete len:212 (+) Transcript_48271:1107-1742(+)